MSNRLSRAVKGILLGSLFACGCSGQNAAGVTKSMDAADSETGLAANMNDQKATHQQTAQNEKQSQTKAVVNEGEGINAPASEVTSTKKDACSLPNAKATLEEWVDANNTLGLKLLKMLDGNAVVSPYSAERVFGMIVDGACSQTFQEMVSALQMPQAFNLSELGSQIEANLKQSNGQSLFESDNRIWLDQEIPIRDDYTDMVRERYGVGIKKVKFAQDTSKILREINQTVSEATHGKIPQILDSLNAKTKIALTNAVYFKASWSEAFNAKLTKPLSFQTDKGPIKTPMMHREGEMKAMKTDAYTTAVIPLNGGFSMIVVLPTQNQGETGSQAVARLENDLQAQDVIGFLRSPKAKVSLTMPKWTIDTGLSMKEAMYVLGMKSVWEYMPNGPSINLARLTGISFQENARPEELFYLGDAVQKVFLSIDEEGAEAAAATAVAMRKSAPRPGANQIIPLMLDRPFLYFIVQSQTATVLFTGHMLTPEKANAKLNPSRTKR